MTMQVRHWKFLSLTNFSADEQDIVIGSVRNKTIGKMIKYFDKIKWTTTAVSDLEKSVLGGDIGHYCVTSAVVCAHKYSQVFFKYNQQKHRKKIILASSYAMNLTKSGRGQPPYVK